MKATKARAKRLARTCLACIGNDHPKCWGDVPVRFGPLGSVLLPCACAKRQHLVIASPS